MWQGKKLAGEMTTDRAAAKFAARQRASCGSTSISPSSCSTIACNRSGSKTWVASESDPKLARWQPSLRSTYRSDDRVEQKQQDQRAILIHVQLAIACLVALAAHIVQRRKERQQLIEIFQPGDFFFGHFFALLVGHNQQHARSPPRAQVHLIAVFCLPSTAQIPCRTGLGLPSSANHQQNLPPDSVIGYNPERPC